jgi:hypothetical protein
MRLKKLIGRVFFGEKPTHKKEYPCNSGNPLKTYFEQNNRRLIHKWMHYFEVYHRHFEQFRGKPITMLEIGVYHGGSLQMWKDYFGPQAHIIGVDVNPDCHDVSEDQIDIRIGDQADRKFLTSLLDEFGPFDIVLDDGGHMMDQQLISFEELYPNIKPDGVYLCEDLHTSYWKEYGGGHQKTGTFMEFTKGLIDQLNAFHSREERLEVNDYTRSTHSMHYYDSILVIEKRKRNPPEVRKTGYTSY